MQGHPPILSLEDQSDDGGPMLAHQALETPLPDHEIEDIESPIKIKDMPPSGKTFVPPSGDTANSLSGERPNFPKGILMNTSGEKSLKHMFQLNLVQETAKSLVPSTDKDGRDILRMN